MNFCTLFDSVYLSRGLVMYESLKKYTPDFHLFIFAFDDLAYDILTNLNLEDCTVICLNEFEDKQLLKVKETRSRAEYCWTCTSSTIKFVLDRYSVPSCTYLDADLCFYGSADILINEMPDSKSVLITEHRYSSLSGKFEMKRAGRFCVQFITFKNNIESRQVLDKWIAQCISWCYARYEDGKFGDQKYLDSWPDEYPCVYILQHQGGGVAPWNVRQYRFTFSENSVKGYPGQNSKSFDVIFFHFHFVRMINYDLADLGWNRLSKAVMNGFYLPYIMKLLEKERFIDDHYSKYKQFFSSGSPKGLKEHLKQLFKHISRYNLVKLTKS